MSVYIERLLIALNVLAFLLMVYDKLAAQSKKRRIPEKIFFLLAVPGGSAGVWLGMKLMQHKTRHNKFAYGIPLLVVVHVTLLLVLSGQG